MTEKKEKPSIAWVRSPNGIVEIYANLAHITWSLDDVRVRLGILVPSAETLSPGKDFRSVVEEKAAVTISWRSAKILALEFARLIQSYEKVNGEINVKPTLTPSPDEAIDKPTVQ